MDQGSAQSWTVCKSCWTVIWGPECPTTHLLLFLISFPPNLPSTSSSKSPHDRITSSSHTHPITGPSYPTPHMSALTSVMYVLSSTEQYFLISTSRGIFLGRFMEKYYKPSRVNLFVNPGGVLPDVDVIQRENSPPS